MRDRAYLLGLLLPVLLASGCRGLGAFEVAIDLAEQRVSGSPLGGLLGGLFEVPIPLDVDVAAETAARETGPAQRVRLVELSLRTTNETDFDFLDSAEVFVQSRQSGSSLPRVRVAIVDPVPGGARQIFFETDEEVDLLPYIREGARLTSSARGRVPPADVTFDGRAVLSVEVL
jgi:hypothetical protein